MEMEMEMEKKSPNMHYNHTNQCERNFRPTRPSDSSDMKSNGCMQRILTILFEVRMSKCWSKNWNEFLCMIVYTSWAHNVNFFVCLLGVKNKTNKIIPLHKSKTICVYNKNARNLKIEKIEKW